MNPGQKDLMRFLIIVAVVITVVEGKIVAVDQVVRTVADKEAKTVAVTQAVQVVSEVRNN